MTATRGTATRIVVPAAIERTRTLVGPALRAAVARVPDERMRLVAGYQLGWCDESGTPVEHGGGKLIRPTLAVLSAEAVGGRAEVGVPAGVALELVHNFSLLHDDIMDRDVERRHRPTGWVVFGEGQAILAGNAMLTAAVETMMADTAVAARTVPHLLGTVQQLISGQSADLALERRDDATLAEVLQMEVGKTAALLACAASVGALAAGAAEPAVAALAGFGHHLGLAFQLVDDILGVVGDPAVTGKSASSDVREGKRSAVIVAALSADNGAAGELAALLAGGAPRTDVDVARATELVLAAGGVAWAQAEATRRLDRALTELDRADLTASARADLDSIARFIVARDR